jgi:hypothetical protein
MVLNGNVTSDEDILNFSIVSFFSSLQANKRIPWIVGPKKGNETRIKNYEDFDPNFKEVNIKGRPRLNKKLKHRNSLKTCLSFYVLSLDPSKKKNHTYIIKLYTTGSLNITGIKSESLNVFKLNKYSITALEYFSVYLNKYLGGGYTVNVNKKSFDNMNISCPIIGPRFDRDKISTFLLKKITIYKKTSRESMKAFLLNYLQTSKIDERILGTYICFEFRYNISYLKKILINSSFDRINTLLSMSPRSFSDKLKTAYIDTMERRIYYNTLNKPCNLIYEILPMKGKKRSVTILLNIGNGVLRKLNVFKNSYNTYCKSFDEARLIHNIFNIMFTKHNDKFVINDDVIFELVV